MTARIFAPSLGQLVAHAGKGPPYENDPAELARLTLDMARRTRATHILFPFDVELPAAAIGDEDLDDVEPAEVCADPRIAVVSEAAAFIARVHPVAAHVPSPAALVAQLAGDASAPGRLEAAEDVVSVYARHLLEAGAALLVVETAATESPNGLEPIRRLAELFAVPCLLAGPSGGDVARLSLADLLEPDRVLDVVTDRDVVLTDEAVPPDADLGALTKSANAIVGVSTC